MLNALADFQAFGAEQGLVPNNMASSPLISRKILLSHLIYCKLFVIELQQRETIEQEKIDSICKSVMGDVKREILPFNF